MAETNTTVTETNKAENGSTGAYGGDPTQAVKGGANLPEKAVSTSEPEQTAKTLAALQAALGSNIPMSISPGTVRKK